MTSREIVRHQYETFPYPPISSIALPQRNQGALLRYELGTQFAFQEEKSHSGIRILVAGAGTFETLVVAQAHPKAKEIIAVDLSEKSLRLLRRRIHLARLLRMDTRLPPIRLICGDLFKLSELFAPDFQFDYILASNVLHHTPDPGLAMAMLSQSLKPNGILRMVTYPHSSRIWMRETAKWLQLNKGLNSQRPLRSQTKLWIRTLPSQHPVRLCYETQPETHTDAGLVDAFYHALENPLRPLEWEKASQAASLTLIGETQTESSRSKFLPEVVPRLDSLSSWEKLEILDDLLELCANPTLWFKKGETPIEGSVFSDHPWVGKENLPRTSAFSFLPASLVDGKIIEIQSSIFWELKQNLLRIESLIQSAETRSGTSFNTSLTSLLNEFKKEVGPRVDPKNSDRPLPGLALSDYALNEILATLDPSSVISHQALGDKYRIRCPLLPEAIPGSHWRDQLEWLQIRLGALQNRIPVQLA